MGLPTDGFNDELSAVFARYREACPEPELSSGFTPGIWRKIESRRRFSLSVGRLSRRFVSAAAALCLLMAMLLAMPQSQPVGVYSSSYLEALAIDHSPDDLQFAELDRRDGEMN
jgi:hypothetical protein